MNTYGFTLIELVAIIAILALIFILSFPNLFDIAKEDKDNQEEKIKENLCLSGRQYIYSNIDDFDNLSIVGNKIEIKISDLFEYGNIKEEYESLSKDKSIYNDSLIYTVQEDYSLKCKYERKSKEV